ncbi:MAG: ATP-dependent DNA helicase RecG [Candidatus Kapaibacteriota bacterium]
MTTLPLQYVKGIGPKRAEALAAEHLRTPLDVLNYVPRGYVQRDTVPTLHALQRHLTESTLWVEHDSIDHGSVDHDREISIIATVVDVAERVIGKNRKMLTATIADDSGVVARLVFWNALAYYKRLLVVGATYVVSGKPEFDGRYHHLTFSHPEVERIDDDDIATYRNGAILPKYPLTQGLRNAGVTMRVLRSLVDQILPDARQQVPEFIPDDILRAHSLMDRAEAYRELHQPPSMDAVHRAQHRMKFEELFEFQLFLARRQSEHKTPQKGLTMHPRSPHARALIERLPFQLTSAQKRVIHEISNDMSSGVPMNRLLQGDVGSGKTIVALLCMLNVVDNTYQAVLMAPTEILAEQHARSLRAWLEGTDITVALVVGGQTKKQRQEALQQIAGGQAQLIVGTHAAFEADVTYHRLGLIVIDEQHRFGVAQRAELRRLGIRSHDGDHVVPHMLVMSATPIPRTLSMTLYGDLDVSVINELPSQRKPIDTRVVFESYLPATYAFMREQIAQGRQAYIVYPLVEKSDKLELKSAVEHHEQLQSDVFPDLRLGLLHGQMPWQEKDQVMRAFLEKEFDILVATTVIEVGVDVPNATVMLIENAERFGLSQLHQLRGRVGRGAHQSYCFLVAKDHFRYQMRRNTDPAEGMKAAVRLRTLERTTDGFEIAEVDLRLRGPGDLLGTRQSGLPEFRFADLQTDGELVQVARTEAFRVVAADPQLRRPEHAALRQQLISRFEAGTYQTVA